VQHVTPEVPQGVPSGRVPPPGGNPPLVVAPPLLLLLAPPSAPAPPSGAALTSFPDVVDPQPMMRTNTAPAQRLVRNVIEEILSLSFRVSSGRRTDQLRLRSKRANPPRVRVHGRDGDRGVRE
jgi:hypothetical protein